MKIREISWENYRRLVDGRIQVRDHLVLVGPNDSGKSSILRAINLCLGVPGSQLASSVRPRDFTSVDAPLVLEVVLIEMTDEDRAAFPDEIDIGPPESLTIHLEATIDPEDPTVVAVDRYFPLAGHLRSVSRVQFEVIGWTFVAATRSLIRELGTGSGGAANELLAGLDLSADTAAFEEARTHYREALEGSTAIGEFRQALADALTVALPSPVAAGDIGVTSAADLLDSPLAGVAVTIRDGDQFSPIAEQSDGVRALTLLALFGLARQSARIVGVDEPETHLHATAQRSVAEGLRNSDGQRVVATHSSAIVSRMSPLDIAAFGADRRVRQLPMGAHIAGLEVSTRHWGYRMIEPLTAKRIVMVEGPSDRILCSRVAELRGYNLDRSGITLFELDSGSMFPTANKLFGTAGFDLPVYGLVDSDAASLWAHELGIARTELEAYNIVECAPDLEGVYVGSLGAERMLELLTGGGPYSKEQVLAGCRVSSVADLTTELIANYCRHNRRKVRAALAVARGITAAEAATIDPVARLMDLACN